jgi:hypothetical protein
MVAPFSLIRARQGAATLRLAASSGASRLATTTQTEGDH